jgi:hypothetical protein
MYIVQYTEGFGGDRFKILKDEVSVKDYIKNMGSSRIQKVFKIDCEVKVTTEVGLEDIK